MVLWKAFVRPSSIIALEYPCAYSLGSSDRAEHAYKVYFTGLFGQVQALIFQQAARFPENLLYDSIIGFIHHVDERNICLPEFWRDKPPRETVRRYLETMLACVKRCDCFDVPGHVLFQSFPGIAAGAC